MQDFVDGPAFTGGPYIIAFAAIAWGLLVIFARKVPIRDGADRIIGFEPVNIGPVRRWTGGILLIGGGVFLLCCQLTGV